MKQGLRHFIYVSGGLLLGTLLGLLLVQLKWVLNQNEEKESVSGYVAQIEDETVETLSEETMSDEASSGETKSGDIKSTDEIKEDKESVNEDTFVRYSDDDLIFYLGHDFSDIQSRFNTSEQTLSKEYQYFKEECLAVSYDDNTREILCIENDGEGLKQICICGFCAGMNRLDVLDRLGADVSLDDSEDNEGHVAFSDEIDGISYITEITLKNDIVTRVTCRRR